MDYTSSPRISKTCPTKTAVPVVKHHRQVGVMPGTTTLNQATRAHLETTKVLPKTGRSMPAPLSVVTAVKKDPRRRCVKTTGPPTLQGLLGRGPSGFLSSLLQDVAHAKEDILNKRRVAATSATAASPLKRRRISVLSTSSSSSSPDKEDDSATSAAADGQQMNQALESSLGHPPPPAPLLLDLLWEESWLAPAGGVLPPAMRRSVAAFCAPNVPPPPPQPPAAEPAVAVIEPDLPATVSDAVMAIDSSSTSRYESALSLPSAKDESFGWFVAMDEDSEDEDFALVHPSSSSLENSIEASGLTVSGPRRSSTASAEVEWAKAADTVDDVLGDLF